MLHPQLMPWYPGEVSVGVYSRTKKKSDEDEAFLKDRKIE